MRQIMPPIEHDGYNECPVCHLSMGYLWNDGCQRGRTPTGVPILDPRFAGQEVADRE